MRNIFNDIGFIRKFIFYSLIFVYSLISYWLFWPYTPMVIEDPIRICNENKKVYQGENLVYKLTLDKRMNVPVTLSRQLIDTFVITYAPIVSNLPVGKSVRHISLPISAAADPGLYRLKWEGAYQVNPIRTVHVVAWSEPFEILKRDR